LGTTKKELNYKKKRATSYAQQALSQQLQQSGTEMDTLVSGVKIHQSIR
jgi:hypothetical protein